MIVTVGNTKGGVGKSTLAVQIAIGLKLAGKRVWLVDGDRQCTSLGAMTVRAESGLPGIVSSAYDDGATLRTQVTLQKSAYEFVIIDAGGRDSTALRAGLMISELILIPFKPRSFDVWALADIGRLVAEARAGHDIKALALLNAADPAGKDNQDAIEAIAELDGMELATLPDSSPIVIGDRKAIAHASAGGMHISEYKPRNAAAIEEIGSIENMLLQYHSDIANVS